MSFRLTSALVKAAESAVGQNGDKKPMDLQADWGDPLMAKVFGGGPAAPGR